MQPPIVGVDVGKFALGSSNAAPKRSARRGTMVSGIASERRSFIGPVLFLFSAAVLPIELHSRRLFCSVSLSLYTICCSVLTRLGFVIDRGGHHEEGLVSL